MSVKRLFFCLAFLLATLNVIAASQDSLNLKGVWSFKMDPHDRGINERWYEKIFDDSIQLPGSMNGNNKGDAVSLSTKWTGSIYDSSFYYNPRLSKYRQPGNIYIPFWLSPQKHYVGAAWYNREIIIPKAWKGRRILLTLERCHFKTILRIDGKVLGAQNSLVAPHIYDLGSLLHEGKHLISLCIDNRLTEVNVGPDSHSVTDHTQGNWNGVIGDMHLRAGSALFIDDMQVYPDLKNHKVVLRLNVINLGQKKQEGTLDVSALSFNTDAQDGAAVRGVRFHVNPCDTQRLVTELKFGKGMLAWDEFDPALYRMVVSLKQRNAVLDEQTTEFGMRQIEINGRQLMINGRALSLRGTVNNCEFPLTGYPPTDVDSWIRIFEKAKSYGLNHMRFHSWCPPEAAFKAADRMGFYLQPEAPSWPNHGPKIGLGQPIDAYIYQETLRMERFYGNHASYVMLSAGNEPAGNQVSYLNAFVSYWKKRDARRIYTGMSVGGSWPVVPQAQYQVRGGVRGLAWNKRPESISDFSMGIAPFDVPFITHEMGQYCVFPNFDEIKKYTGSYRARNFELFRQDLQDHGMADQAHDFLMASGKLQLLCYKNEIEKVLRTPGYAGFQLLGLQDFPGQGTALVGVLDAFWDAKGYASAADFSRFCNSTVPLLSLPKFTYNNDETLAADVKVYHYGSRALRSPSFVWSISDESGRVLSQGRITRDSVPSGNGQFVGHFQYKLDAVKVAQQLKLEVKIEGTSFANNWNVWVYPINDVPVADNVHYTDTLGDKEKQILDKGGKVFLNLYGHVVKGREVVMQFLPVFWNTSWFKMRPPHVTGMLIKDESAAFSKFPTESSSDLQWWDIVSRNQVMHLEDFPAGFRPLIQPIDTWFLNRRLAMLFEAKVGRGRIIVCSADLSADTANRPAARQLQRSLSEYMNSSAFDPQDDVSFSVIQDLAKVPSRELFNTYTKDSPDELKPSHKNKK